MSSGVSNQMAWPFWTSSRTHSIEIICREKSRYSYQPCAATSSRKTHLPAGRQISSPLQTWRKQKHEQALLVALFQTCLWFCFCLLQRLLLSCLPLFFLLSFTGHKYPSHYTVTTEKSTMDSMMYLIQCVTWRQELHLQSLLNTRSSAQREGEATPNEIFHEN